jgi:hypothetical protein
LADGESQRLTASDLLNHRGADATRESGRGVRSDRGPAN